MRSFPMLLGCLVVAVVCLSKAGQAPLAAEEVEVVQEDARIRDAPHRAASEKAQVDRGAVLSLVPPYRAGSYLRVRLSQEGVEGWIHQSLVRPVLPERAADLRRAAEHSALRSGESTRDAEAASGRHVALGRPVAVHERSREGYAVAVDGRLRIPLWVQYELRADDLDGPGDRDDSRFEADESLPILARAQLADYRGSGLDRGHLAPAGDMKRSQAVMDESFLLSNIAPQVGRGFNRDIWRLLEEAVRDWVRQRGALTIITGPIFSADETETVTYDVIGENEVAVPNAFFKVIVDPAEREALAFVIPNRELLGREFSEFLTSIDEIEAQTGLDLLSELADGVEEALEAETAEEVWATEERLRALVERVAAQVRLSLVEFDEEGRLRDPGRLDALLQEAPEGGPTHVFLLAHGWNNSRSEALSSYRMMLNILGEVADAHAGLRPQPYRPFVIGVHWPSKAWDDESGRIRSLAADEDLTLAICKTLPAERSPSTYVRDVETLRGLLLKPPEAVTAEDYDTAWSLFRRYSLEAEVAEDQSIFDQPRLEGRGAELERGAAPSIPDLFRIFTFWQMKKRAGVVGQSGGRRLVERVMREFPHAQLHLAAHSFGSKFFLAAIDRPQALPRKIDSLILLQAAISSYAFADRVPGHDRPGGYRAALAAVRGPVVATYSSHDWPLTYAYPLGSRLAGQVGELQRASDISRYAALGAVGAVGGRRATLNAAPARYRFAPGLWSVNGGDLIDGHSGYYNLHVAWLIWSVIGQSR